jgi:hypothetical protein
LIRSKLIQFRELDRRVQESKREKLSQNMSQQLRERGLLWEKEGKNGGAQGGIENEAVIWKKTGRGRSAVNVASWGVLSIDVGLSSRLPPQFTLTIPIWIQFNSFAAARSCCAASQHRTSREEWERLPSYEGEVNSKAVSQLSAVVWVRRRRWKDEERERDGRG